MATARLLRPNRLSKDGVIYDKDVTVEVPMDVARSLARDGRFLVDYEASVGAEPQTFETESVQVRAPAGKKPSTKAGRIAAIRDAATKVDADDEKNFTRSGKVDARALSSVLGWSVTGKERDEALGEEPDEDEEVQAAPAKAPKGKKGIRITSKASKPAPAADDETTAGAKEIT